VCRRMTVAGRPHASNKLTEVESKRPPTMSACIRVCARACSNVFLCDDWLTTESTKRSMQNTDEEAETDGRTDRQTDIRGERTSGKDRKKDRKEPSKVV
jgi:hypothetical protein